MILSLPFLGFLLLPSCVCVGTANAAMTDPATGITFAPKTTTGLELFGVGVRKKGPIKVYSVGLYGTSDLKDQLASCSRSEDAGQKAVRCLRDGTASSPSSFELQMSFKVGGDKMASAIAESVAPRHKGSSSDVDQLKSIIASGVGPDGAIKGTTFTFDCTDSGVAVSVNGQRKGEVESSTLARAFCDVYLDEKPVSPALKASVLENCCSP